MGGPCGAKSTCTVNYLHRRKGTQYRYTSPRRRDRFKDRSRVHHLVVNLPPHMPYQDDGIASAFSVCKLCLALTLVEGVEPRRAGLAVAVPRKTLCAGSVQECGSINWSILGSESMASGMLHCSNVLNHPSIVPLIRHVDGIFGQHYYEP